MLLERELRLSLSSPFSHGVTGSRALKPSWGSVSWFSHETGFVIDVLLADLKMVTVFH